MQQNQGHDGCEHQPLKVVRDTDQAQANMTTFSNTTRTEIFNLAWTFVKRLGFTMSEALKVAWRNAKLRKALTKGICHFYFQKIDGSIREAYGTLNDRLVPPTAGSDRRRCNSVQVYFDTEKQEWRCYKKANLLEIA